VVDETDLEGGAEDEFESTRETEPLDLFPPDTEEPEEPGPEEEDPSGNW
jgi:hypothetical protein